MSIPNFDFFEKFIAFIGFSIMTFSLFQIYESLSKRHKELEEFYKQATLVEFKSNERLKNTNEYSAFLNGILSEQTSTISNFDSGKIDIKTLNTQLKKIDKKYTEKGSIYDKKLEIEKKTFDSLYSKYNLNNKIQERTYDLFKIWILVNFLILLIGLYIFMYGAEKWYKKELFERELIQRQNLQLPTFSTNCQSCGCKFNSLNIQGSNIDGTTNFHYCNNCFANGSFISQETTLPQMQEKTKILLLSTQLKKTKIDNIIKFISTLDRWKVDNYI